MDIIQLMIGYGVDTFVIALFTVVFTGLFKIPIKKLAAKTENSKKITRFVTFLPILFGFGLTALINYLLTKQVNLNKDFYVQWLSSVSLSLAIYAFWEKFVPSEKQILSDAEIKTNQAVIEELQSKLVGKATDSQTTEKLEESVKAFEHTEEGQAVTQKKIILSNNKNLK